MPTEAKTIQIFLPDGDPRGIRIAEITTRIVQAIAVPRTQLDQFLKRPEAEHVALYFLFGQTEDQAKPLVYVGQTEDVPLRMKNHNANKDFWQAAVLVISRTNSFTQAHIKYLEWFCIGQAKDAGRYALDNGNAGGEPHVTEPMKADIMDAYGAARTLVGTLGFPVFEPLAEKTKDHEIFYCKGPGADAKGQMVEDGFVVFKGSLVRAEPVPSAAKWLRARLDRFEAEGLLERISPRQYRFTQDYLANTPSQAADLILGRSSNGWLDWKDKNGKTLHELKRANTQ